MAVFSKDKNKGGDQQNSRYSAVHSDSIPFAEGEDESYTKLLTEEYVLKKQLELTADELEGLSLTDCAELWRICDLYRREAEKEGVAEKIAVVRRRCDILYNFMAKKLSKAESFYCVINSYTGEPHMFSRTAKQDDGYICTAPNIRIFTAAYAELAKKKFAEPNFEMRKIDMGSDGNGINTFFGECFFQNGAMGVEINNELALVNSGMIITPPDFSKMDDASRPVLNPELMRWGLLMAQMAEPVTYNDRLVYQLYYRFISKEMVKGRFLVPARTDKDPRSFENDKLVVRQTGKNGVQYEVAVIKGRFGRDAVIMYTDWKRFRQRYDGSWSAMTMTAAEMIEKYDIALNLTDKPKLGCYITRDIYNDMQNIAASERRQ